MEVLDFQSQKSLCQISIGQKGQTSLAGISQNLGVSNPQERQKEKPLMTECLKLQT